MKSYWIFATILTVAYVIYYAVNIARDLYRKKGQGGKDEEIFELDPDDGQESVDVTESETGFNVGTERYETDFAAAPASAQDGSADTDAAARLRSLLPPETLILALTDGARVETPTCGISACMPGPFFASGLRKAVEKLRLCPVYLFQLLMTPPRCRRSAIRN